MKSNVILLLGILLWGCCKKEEKVMNGKIPLVVITDLYHPHQDPGDNLDLINGFAMPDVDLRAVILENGLRPCTLVVHDDGRFQFSYTDKPSNISIYFRPNTAENEIALNEALPKLFQSYDQKLE